MRGEDKEDQAAAACRRHFLFKHATSTARHGPDLLLVVKEEKPGLAPQAPYRQQRGRQKGIDAWRPSAVATLSKHLTWKVLLHALRLDVQAIDLNQWGPAQRKESNHGEIEAEATTETQAETDFPGGRHQGTIKGFVCERRGPRPQPKGVKPCPQQEPCTVIGAPSRSLATNSPRQADDDPTALQGLLWRPG
jgi:hypothetical protein